MVYRRQRQTVKRNIYFYRASVGQDPSGYPIPFDPQPAIDEVAALLYSGNTTDWYELEADGNALCLIPHVSIPPLSVRFCRVRRTGLPQLERGGNVRDLDLSPDSGLLEPTHVAFFANNIVGAEYNHYGPRLSRLGNYLYEKSKRTVRRATFHPIIRGDAVQQLNRLTDLRALDFSILPSYAEIVRQRDQSLGDAFEANGRMLDHPKTLRLVLKSERHASTTFLGKIKESLIKLVGPDDAREGIVGLKVHGACEDSQRVETINLLKDELVTKAIFKMGPRSRALNPESAVAAIREAYLELHDQIEGAASVSP